jgi:hypothetical protein
VVLAAPGGLGPQGRVVVLVLAGLRGDGVDDLPVAERVAVPAEVRLQVDGGLGDPRPDDEPQPGVVEATGPSRRGWPWPAGRLR